MRKIETNDQIPSQGRQKIVHLVGLGIGVEDVSALGTASVILHFFRGASCFPFEAPYFIRQGEGGLLALSLFSNIGLYIFLKIPYYIFNLFNQLSRFKAKGYRK